MAARPQSDSNTLIVVESGEDIPPQLTISAEEYLEGELHALERGVTVINLCRSYAYLSKGYYVSLLADARGQKAYPSVDMIDQISNPFAYFLALREAGLDTIEFKEIHGKRRLLPRVIVADAGRTTVLETKENGSKTELRYRKAPLDYVEISAAFGKTTDARFRRQARRIFEIYSFPLLRIRMYREDDGWKVGQIFPIALQQASPETRALLTEQLRGNSWKRTATTPARPKPQRIGCLFDPNDPFKPSDQETLDKFERAALRRGALFETIAPDDLRHVPEFDALFIRTLTGIDQPAFIFAQRARSLGIPVIDDPESIVKCSNKVYLHELFHREAVPTPRTLIVSRRTPRSTILELGPPMIVKLPQGSFSAAVKKADNEKELDAILTEMFKGSPLLIVQEFTPTPYDWRIGVLEGRMLYACKYHQAKDHWQIARRYDSGYTRFGKVEAVPLDEVPARVKRVALKGARLIGDSLYGVDLKDVDGKALMIEVNDNPNIETGCEDAHEKDRLYDQVIASLLKRIRREKIDAGKVS